MGTELKRKTVDFDNPPSGSNNHTVNLKGVDVLEIVYASNIKDCITNKTISGSSLVLNVCGNTDKYTFTNVSSVKRIEIKKNASSEPVFSGTLEEFYTENATEIDWFNANKLNTARGTLYSDSINASLYAPVSSSSTKGVTVYGGAGDDVITGSEFNDKLYGENGSDSIISGYGKDSVYGGAGDDYIENAGGDSYLSGGDGNDTIFGGLGNTSICGGRGETTVDYNGESFGQHTFILTNGEKLNISGLTNGSGGKLTFVQDSRNKNNMVVIGGNGVITIKDYLKKDTGATVTINDIDPTKKAVLDPIDGAYFVNSSTNKLKTNKYTGSYLAEVINASGASSYTSKGFTLNGRAGSDSIIGSSNADKLYGGAGDDTIFGGAGNDSIYGGTGENTLMFDSTNNNGENTYFLTEGETLKIDMDTIVGGISHGKTNKNDLVIRNDKGSVVIKNYLSKSSGAEVILNNVKLSETKLFDTVDENYFLQSSSSSSKTKVIQNYTGTSVSDVIDASKIGTSITLSSKKSFTINGGAGNDTILGSGYGDKLYGGDGSDSIIGGISNDVLYGGAGDDTLYGGAGNDSVIGGQGITTSVYDDNDFGTDTYIATKGEQINISGLQFTSITGAHFETKKNDVIVNSDKGTIVLKDAASKELGAEIIVNDKNIAKESVLGPVDTSYFLKSTASGTKVAHQSYTGTAIADVIDASSVSSYTSKGFTLNGGAGSDSIIGSSNADKLYGGAGDDTIFGGAGNDTITGGKGVTTALYDGSAFGNDTYILTAGETLNFNINLDTIASSQGDHFKSTSKGNNLTFFAEGGEITLKNYLNPTNTAVVNFNVTGSNGADMVILEHGNDSISGGAGDDYLNGGAGDDTIFGGAGDDYLVGDAGCDSVSGGVGNDIIFGGDGDDTILGGLGNDTIYAGSGDNTLQYENSEFGNDIYMIEDKDKVSITGLTSVEFDKVVAGENTNLKLSNANGSITVTDYFNSKINAKLSVKSAQNEDNTYNVKSFGDDTSLNILENGGNDTLIINANANDISAVFNVVKDGNNYNADVTHTTFIKKTALNKDTLADCFDGDSEVNIKGVNIVDNSETNKGADVIKTADYTDGLDKAAWYNKIVEQVGGWLTGAGCLSVENAILDYKSGNITDTQMGNLVNAFKCNYLDS